MPRAGTTLPDVLYPSSCAAIVGAIVRAVSSVQVDAPNRDADLRHRNIAPRSPERDSSWRKVRACPAFRNLM